MRSATVGGFKVRRASQCLARACWRAGPLCPVARLALSPTSHLATHSAHSDCRTLIVTTPSIDLTGCSQISLLVTEELTVCKLLQQVALSPDSHQFPIPFPLLPHWQPPHSLCCKCGGRESGPRPLLRMFRASPATSRGEGHAGTRARPPPTPTPHKDPSPPSQPRRASSRPPASSGIKCKSIPLDLGHLLIKFAAWGVRIRGSNMLPKLIDCGTKVYFRNF